MTVLFRYSLPAALFLLAQFAQAELTFSALQDANPEFDWGALESGEIVWQGVASAEKIDAELVGFMAVKLPASAARVAEALARIDQGQVNIPLDVSSQKTLRASLEAFELPRGPDVDLDWFYEPEADGTFNLSKAELEKLKSSLLAAKKQKLNEGQLLDRMQTTVRELLADRVSEYKQGGLTSIEPYYVDGDEISPGYYLGESIKDMSLLKEREPEFYQALLSYPKFDTGRYQSQYFLTRSEESGRPLVSLKHWMVEQRSGFQLIAERLFFMSHSLDAMHTVILIMEKGQHSYLFLLNQSFTQKVTGFGSAIAHKVGRSQVKGNVLPLFEALKSEFSGD